MAESADYQEKIAADIRDVFATEPGKRVLEYLKRKSFFYWASIQPGDKIDPLAVVWAESRRGLVLDLVLKADPPGETKGRT